MNPKSESYKLLGVTRSKAKMFEYDVPSQYHLTLTKQPSSLLSLTIGILGNYNKLETADQNDKFINEHRDNLVFSAQFFDSFVESKLESSLATYYLLVGSAAYYLADLPGSASVLAKRIKVNHESLNVDNLDDLLICLLQNNSNKSIKSENDNYHNYINNILVSLHVFYLEGNNERDVLYHLDSLCKYTYAFGTDRHLLFSDIIKSVTRKKISNSSWSSLKKYSDLDIDKWKNALVKSTFIQEFWPAQKILGEKNIYNGKSAIIQMPTSAGKTKSLELIIRSSFFSERTNLAIIIAPFRALCSEIKNSLQHSFKNEGISIDVPSDAIQTDFNLFESFDLDVSKSILILTPEKFMYILRNLPGIVDKLGLIIYDEGHQFDNGIRGVTYELLLSSLKSKVSSQTQVILISAVISNAQAIGNWLINKDKEIISGINLLPSHKAIAFTNWQTELGMLQFVNNESPEEVEYFVPRILEQVSLKLKRRERKERLFPDKNDGNDIALYLALKLIHNGTVAIFCGSKSTVKSIYEQLLDIDSRNYNISTPLKYSDQIEIDKLFFLHSQHFGEDSTMSKSAKLGVFTHSSNTPEGLRLAIEYSMQKEKIKFVICTSTLAQGVNLPIKYLMITSFYQAGQKIKTRDFHNLIGRAGRSGMHTEGSIIFTDTDLFDKKHDRRENWKWKLAKNMLDPINSEPCGSTLLSIFAPLKSDNERHEILLDPLELVTAYLESPLAVSKLLDEYLNKYSSDFFSINNLSRQITFKIEIISSIESYLMTYSNVFEIDPTNQEIDNITKETLAYLLSNAWQKQQLLELFRILANNVNLKIPSNKRVSYGKTLLGVEDMLEVELWTINNLEKLETSSSYTEIFENIWPILYKKCASNLKKLTPIESSYNLAKMWIKGLSYNEILQALQNDEIKIRAGSQVRLLNQEHIIDICQTTFSYSITLTIAAIIEVIKLQRDETYDNPLLFDLKTLQKMIKYGLPNQKAITLYEIGFADRVVALDLATTFSTISSDRTKLPQELKLIKYEVLELLIKYPSYFENMLLNIVD